MTSVSRFASHLLFAAFASLFLLAGSGNAAAAKDGWSKNARQTSVGGFVVGKANAPAQIVEYVSYTCPHCAHFETEEMQKVGASYVTNGKANIEIRIYWRDYVDLTVAMLARCGKPADYFARHRHLMATQEEWRKRTDQIRSTTAAHIKGEYATKDEELSDTVAYMLAAFDDMQFAKLVAPLGITPVAARKCLSDKAALQQIMAMTDEAISRYGVPGTPSFLFNGTMDEGLYDFATIKARIDRG